MPHKREVHRTWPSGLNKVWRRTKPDTICLVWHTTVEKVWTLLVNVSFEKEQWRFDQVAASTYWDETGFVTHVGSWVGLFPSRCVHMTNFIEINRLYTTQLTFVILQLVTSATCFGLVWPSSGLQKLVSMKVHNVAVPMGSHGLHCLYVLY